MSQRIARTFAALQEKNEGALVVFVTAGDPSLKHTAEIIGTLAQSGADIIEVGIPYSDPLADGPVIQASTQRALDRGMTPPLALETVSQARALTDKPIVLMTSYNLVLRYGLDRFAQVASQFGADGTILTDLPPEEARDWKEISDKHGLATIFLVAPTSTPARIAKITEMTTGFVYCVSRTGVTGARSEMAAELQEFLSAVRKLTDKPLCVGFGISSPEHVAQVVGLADGAVIGSALVDFLHHNAENSEQDLALRLLVKEWKEATVRHR